MAGENYKLKMTMKCLFGLFQEENIDRLKGDTGTDAVMVIAMRFTEDGKINADIVSLDGRKGRIREEGVASKAFDPMDELSAWLLLSHHILAGPLEDRFKSVVRLPLIEIERLKHAADAAKGVPNVQPN